MVSRSILVDLEIYLIYLKLLVVILVSFYIYFKASRLYRLSFYNGLKIFSLSFLFFGIAYFIILINVFLSIFLLPNEHIYIGILISFLIYYSFTMGVLMLVYSLVWKEIQDRKNTKKKSLSFNSNFLSYKMFFEKRLLFLNLIGILIGIISVFRIDFMFLILLILLIYAITLSYSNYFEDKLRGKKKNFSQLYLITLILVFIGFMINFLLSFFYISRIYEHVVTIIIFLIFFYGAYNFGK